MRDTEFTETTGARILVLCAEDRLGTAFAQMLSSRGHTVSQGKCDAGALDTVRAASPDVIVIEAGTRDGAGLALCQSIRHCRDMDGARLLMLQDQGREIDRRRAKALGADGFLAMPFGMAALCDEASRLIRLR